MEIEKRRNPHTFHADDMIGSDSEMSVLVFPWSDQIRENYGNRR